MQPTEDSQHQSCVIFRKMCTEIQYGLNLKIYLMTATQAERDTFLKVLNEAGERREK